MKSNGLKYSIYLVFVSLLVGCSAASTALRSDTDWNNRTLLQRYEALVADTCGWQTLSFSGKVKMTSPEKHSCTAKIFMVRDSLIHISFRAYGVEGAVVRIMSDSVSIYDKVDKVVMSTSIGKFFGESNISLYDVQLLILGRFPASLVSRDPFVHKSKTAKEWSIGSQIPDEDSSFRWTILIDTSLNLPSEAKFFTQTAKAYLEYSKWKNVADLTIPTSCVLAYSHSFISERYSLRFSISTGSVKVNQGQAPRWRVGRDARAADFDQMKHQLINNTMQ